MKKTKQTKTKQMKTRQHLSDQLKTIDTSGFIWYLIGRMSLKYDYKDWLLFVNDYKENFTEEV